MKECRSSPVVFKATHCTYYYSSAWRQHLNHELSVSLCPRYYNIHPYSHSFRRGRNHVVHPIVSLHTECEGRVWTLKERWEITVWPVGGSTATYSKNKVNYYYKYKAYIMNSRGKVPCGRSLSGHNTLPLWPGNKSLLSVWPRVCLKPQKVQKVNIDVI